MTDFKLKTNHLVPKLVIEQVTLKKIMLQYPEAIQYKSLIKFKHTGGKAALDLDLLPAELAKKIMATFIS